ncbi:hypothetical protein CBR_g16861 [Chara braunii]|uniref:Uncharacterized protein n=1 Tax=Chara braunii TaxID=69332 RepID=A0A388KU44_CHABU|nr:hypothetical protein CBR_g16861 [Chara braunii]|eukprot:GBG73518.1 hypothetical protein CBR_g16861 [Chara braunii]
MDSDSHEEEDWDFWHLHLDSPHEDESHAITYHRKILQSMLDILISEARFEEAIGVVAALLTMGPSARELDKETARGSMKWSECLKYAQVFTSLQGDSQVSTDVIYRFYRRIIHLQSLQEWKCKLEMKLAAFLLSRKSYQRAYDVVRQVIRVGNFRQDPEVHALCGLALHGLWKEGMVAELRAAGFSVSESGSLLLDDNMGDDRSRDGYGHDEEDDQHALPDGDNPEDYDGCTEVASDGWEEFGRRTSEEEDRRLRNAPSCLHAKAGAKDGGGDVESAEVLNDEDMEDLSSNAMSHLSDSEAVSGRGAMDIDPPHAAAAEVSSRARGGGGGGGGGGEENTVAGGASDPGSGGPGLRAEDYLVPPKSLKKTRMRGQKKGRSVRGGGDRKKKNRSAWDDGNGDSCNDSADGYGRVGDLKGETQGVWEDWDDDEDDEEDNEDAVKGDIGVEVWMKGATTLCVCERTQRLFPFAPDKHRRRLVAYKLPILSEKTHRLFTNAVRHLKRVVSLDPDSISALSALVELRVASGKTLRCLKEVETCCRKSKTIQPFGLYAAILEAIHPKDGQALGRCYEEWLLRDPLEPKAVSWLCDTWESGNLTLLHALLLFACHLDRSPGDNRIWMALLRCISELKQLVFQCENERFRFLTGSEEQIRPSALRATRPSSPTFDGHGGVATPNCPIGGRRGDQGGGASCQPCETATECDLCKDLRRAVRTLRGEHRTLVERLLGDATQSQRRSVDGKSLDGRDSVMADDPMRVGGTTPVCHDNCARALRLMLGMAFVDRIDSWRKEHFILYDEEVSQMEKELKGDLPNFDKLSALVPRSLCAAHILGVHNSFTLAALNGFIAIEYDDFAAGICGELDTMVWPEGIEKLIKDAKMELEVAEEDARTKGLRTGVPRDEATVLHLPEEDDHTSRKCLARQRNRVYRGWRWIEAPQQSDTPDT